MASSTTKKKAAAPAVPLNDPSLKALTDDLIALVRPFAQASQDVKMGAEKLNELNATSIRGVVQRLSTINREMKRDACLQVGKDMAEACYTNEGTAKRAASEYATIISAVDILARQKQNVMDILKGAEDIAELVKSKKNKGINLRDQVVKIARMVRTEPGIPLATHLKTREQAIVKDPPTDEERAMAAIEKLSNSPLLLITVGDGEGILGDQARRALTTLEKLVAGEDVPDEFAELQAENESLKAELEAALEDLTQDTPAEATGEPVAGEDDDQGEEALETQMPAPEPAQGRSGGIKQGKEALPESVIGSSFDELVKDVFKT